MPMAISKEREVFGTDVGTSDDSSASSDPEWDAGSNQSTHSCARKSPGGKGDSKTSTLRYCFCSALALAVVAVVALVGRSYLPKGVEEVRPLERSQVVLMKAVAGGQPNPPIWPDSVKVFGPDTDYKEMEDAVHAAYQQNGGHYPGNHGQFSEGRFAFLFKKGTYHLDVPVGFYTQVLGTGLHPADVEFKSHGGVYSEEGMFEADRGALQSFWRGVENIKNAGNWASYGVNAGGFQEFTRWVIGWHHRRFRKTYKKFSPPSHGMMWAVSQGCVIRSVIVDGDLWLNEDERGFGSGSGGFSGNTRVHGAVQAPSQQQWMSRNDDYEKGWPFIHWDMVFVGTKNAPKSHDVNAEGAPCPGKVHSIMSKTSTPAVAEKPFIHIDPEDDKYYLVIPAVKFDRIGVDFEHKGARAVGFESVYVATDKDDAAVINSKLAEGLHVVLSPGVYRLKEPLRVVQENQVLLGLGFATLIADAGNALVEVGNVDGVRVAGLLLEAGKEKSDNLMIWGGEDAFGNAYEGKPTNPGFIFDVFVRVGGATMDVEAGTMMKVVNGNVIGDNIWLWRADHGLNDYHAINGDCPSQRGLEVSGDNVIMYGLSAEHNLQEQVLWTGEHGRVFFAQMELPYDVSAAYKGLGYRVGPKVTAHEAWGVAVYHFFRDYNVSLPSAIVAPAAVEESFLYPLVVGLSGTTGRIQHVLNNKGEATWGLANQASMSYVCPPAAGSSVTSELETE
eukprot:TRINITY_DN6771_c0_g1_i1.p1 TRINITY_DN6771_c0_g1~~TRINITY_DN6771_c0_g1_i1.p1  ORF type:complete len:728 (+),score=119.56 TRINITY_DN6771_c0_g1_i1:125-2308(+)